MKNMRLLHEGIEYWGEHTPDAPAVTAGDRQLTYGEIDQLTGRISQLLASLGVEPGARVGVYMDKSVEAVAAIYGVSKAGAAYVPIDPHQPAARASYIASNCGIDVMISQQHLQQNLAAMLDEGATFRSCLLLDVQDPASVVGLDAIAVATACDVADQAPVTAVTSTIDRDIAYLLYTSGSTGQPKGVTLSHQNGMAFASWAVEEFRIDQTDRVAQVAPLIFDLSTFDLFATAIAGASLHMVSKEVGMFPRRFRQLLLDQRISVVYAVPSMLTMLLERGGLEDGDLPELRTLLFAGEVFPTKHLSRLMGKLAHVEFANLYGPTETNVCTFHRVAEAPAEDEPPVPIGIPIANDAAYVVDETGALVPKGTMGELWIRGATVMQGYWGNEQRSAEVLIDNPFAAHLPDPVYKTGDLVVEDDDGVFIFCGRRDSQVKRMGYRVELGEIEAALAAHPAISEAALVALPDDAKGTRLIAHVASNEHPPNAELMAFCLDRVPRYMLPDELEQHERLPLTATGKTDRVALRTMSEKARQENT